MISVTEQARRYTDFLRRTNQTHAHVYSGTNKDAREFRSHLPRTFKQVTHNPIKQGLYMDIKIESDRLHAINTYILQRGCYIADMYDGGMMLYDDHGNVIAEGKDLLDLIANTPLIIGNGTDL